MSEAGRKRIHPTSSPCSYPYPTSNRKPRIQLNAVQRNQLSSISAVSSPTSLHSLLLSASFLMPAIRSAHKLSTGVRNVYPRCELMTPIACNTAFLESLPNTAGWLIHSRLDSNSVSKADTVRASTLDEAFRSSFRSFAWVVCGEEFALRSGSGVSVVVGDTVGLSDDVGGGPGDRADGGIGRPPEGGGRGGRPPLPRPFKILRVSLSR